jgi:hypothetical protein
LYLCVYEGLCTRGLRSTFSCWRIPKRPATSTLHHSLSLSHHTHSPYRPAPPRAPPRALAWGNRTCTWDIFSSFRLTARLENLLSFSSSDSAPMLTVCAPSSSESILFSSDDPEPCSSTAVHSPSIGVMGVIGVWGVSGVVGVCGDCGMSSGEEARRVDVGLFDGDVLMGGGIALTGEAAPCSRPRIMWSARREGLRFARWSENDEFRFISGCFPGEPRYRPPSLPPSPPRPVSGAGLVVAPPVSTSRNDNNPPALAGVTGADAGDCCVFRRRRRKGAVDTVGLGRLPGFRACMFFARSALFRAENAPPASEGVPLVRSFAMNSSSRESVCGAMLCRRRTIRDVGAHVSGVLSVASSPFRSSSNIGGVWGMRNVAWNVIFN